MSYIKLSDQEKKIIDDEIANSENAEWKQRLNIIRLIDEDVFPSELTWLFNKSENTIKNYIKMYNKGGLKILKPTRKTGQNVESGYAICINNKSYPESLELLKVYKIIYDAQAIKHQLIRVIDESGEDYLYSKDYFIPINLPSNVVNILALQQMAKDAVD